MINTSVEKRFFMCIKWFLYLYGTFAKYSNWCINGNQALPKPILQIFEFLIWLSLSKIVLNPKMINWLMGNWEYKENKSEEVKCWWNWINKTSFLSVRACLFVYGYTIISDKTWGDLQPKGEDCYYLNLVNPTKLINLILNLRKMTLFGYW